MKLLECIAVLKGDCKYSLSTINDICRPSLWVVAGVMKYYASDMGYHNSALKYKGSTSRYKSK